MVCSLTLVSTEHWIKRRSSVACAGFVRFNPLLGGIALTLIHSRARGHDASEFRQDDTPREPTLRVCDAQMVPWLVHCPAGELGGAPAWEPNGIHKLRGHLIPGVAPVRTKYRHFEGDGWCAEELTLPPGRDQTKANQDDDQGCPDDCAPPSWRTGRRLPQWRLRFIATRHVRSC